MPRRNNDSVVLVFVLGFLWLLWLENSKTIPKADPKIVPETKPPTDAKIDFNLAAVEGDEMNDIESDRIENGLSTACKNDIIINSYVTVGNNLYMIVTDKKVNWFQAAHCCRQMFAHLGSISSKTEMQALSGFFKAQKYTQGTTFWTSGNDLGAEGEYYWLANGHRIKYFKWDDNELNNYAGQEDCITLHLKSQEYKMNDANCLDKYNFICVTFL